MNNGVNFYNPKSESKEIPEYIQMLIMQNDMIITELKNIKDILDDKSKQNKDDDTK